MKAQGSIRRFAGVSIRQTPDSTCPTAIPLPVVSGYVRVEQLGLGRRSSEEERQQHMRHLQWLLATLRSGGKMDAS